MMNSFHSTWTIPQLEMSAWIRCTFIAWVLLQLPMVPYQSLTLSKMAKAKKLGRVAVSWIFHLFITKQAVSTIFLVSWTHHASLPSSVGPHREKASVGIEREDNWLHLRIVDGWVQIEMYAGWFDLFAADRSFVRRACDPVDGVIWLHRIVHSFDEHVIRWMGWCGCTG